MRRCLGLVVLTLPLFACSSHKEYVREVVVEPAAEPPPPYTGFVRGTDDPSIDKPAMSTGLDKEDIQRMLRENLGDLRTASIMQRWQLDGGEDRVTVFPFANGTGEPIDAQLDTILGEAETWISSAHVVTLVGRDQQPRMIQEVKVQEGSAFDPSRSARWGRQMGARYYLTGKVEANVESAAGSDRIQYTFFMQVIDVETSGVLWQHTSHVTKMRV